MYLEHLILSNFKNIESADIRLTAGINAFCGNNGEGKTNLLDSVFLLSLCKSSITPRERECIRYGCDNCTLFGSYIFSGGKEEQIACRIESGGEKIFRRGGKKYEKMSAHLGLLPLVMVSPSDASLTAEGAVARRRFADIFLSQVDQVYLKALQEYNHLLMQRNSLLKQWPLPTELLEAVDMQISPRAALIFEKRTALVKEIAPMLAHYYSILSSEREEAGIEYKSDLQKDEMETLLAKSRERDAASQFTTVGIQRDDLLFTLGGRQIRYCASQGQQKSFTVALKLSLFSILSNIKETEPILLLDDVFDKLDENRVKNLLSIVIDNNFGQVLVSDTNRRRVNSMLETLPSSSSLFEVREGLFEKVL